MPPKGAAGRRDLCPLLGSGGTELIPFSGFRPDPLGLRKVPLAPPGRSFPFSGTPTPAPGPAPARDAHSPRTRALGKMRESFGARHL